MATSVANSPVDQVSYADLYARWERGNWAATEIDFSQDIVDWNETLTAEQRRSALWMYSLFFHGEDSVADNLSPYIDAAPLEEQKYFLTTQQVDEARHAVFFHRFMHEVVGRGSETIGSTLAATQDEISWGHRKVFGRLDQMADELRRDRSKIQLAKAVTLYHVVVEATMAQPAQHLIEDYLETYDVLPGFRAGMRNVALDEQRHIAFGIKLLADLYAEDPEPIQEAIVSTLREVVAWTAAVAAPPGWDASYTEAFGFTIDDLGEAGAASMEQKLRMIGLPLEEIHGLPFPIDLPARERARRGKQLLMANMIGEGGPVDRSPENVALLFDQIRRTADTRHAKPGTTIQWEFSDLDPWYLTLDNGSTSAQAGRAPRKPDLTFRCAFDDWVEIVAGRSDPLRLVLRRRLKLRGSPLLLRAMPRIFG